MSSKKLFSVLVVFLLLLPAAAAAQKGGPSISLDPPAGSRGSAVIVEGRNFILEDEVELSFDKAQVGLAFTGRSRNFSKVLYVPKNASQGLH